MMNFCRIVLVLMVAIGAPLIAGCASGTHGSAAIAPGSIADPVTRLDFGISLDELAAIEDAAVVKRTGKHSLGLIHHFTVGVDGSAVLSVGGTIYGRRHLFVFVDGALARILPEPPGTPSQWKSALGWATDQSPRGMAQVIVADIAQPLNEEPACTLDELREQWAADLATQQRIARAMEPGFLPLLAVLTARWPEVIESYVQERRFLDRVRNRSGLRVELGSPVADVARTFGDPLESSTTESGIRFDLFGPDGGVNLGRSSAPWVVVESLDGAVTAAYTFWAWERPAAESAFGR